LPSRGPGPARSSGGAEAHRPFRSGIIPLMQGPEESPLLFWSAVRAPRGSLIWIKAPRFASSRRYQLISKRSLPPRRSRSARLGWNNSASARFRCGRTGSPRIVTSTASVDELRGRYGQRRAAATVLFGVENVPVKHPVKPRKTRWTYSPKQCSQFDLPQRVTVNLEERKTRTGPGPTDVPHGSVRSHLSLRS
jgi:hypothetical protein